MSWVDFLVLIAAAAVIYAVVSSIGRSFFNPIVRVTDELVVDRPSDQVAAEVATLLGTARRVEFSLAGTGSFQLAYRFYPGWSIALGVVLFPIGLLAVYLARERLQLSVTVAGEGSGSRVRVFGRVHKKLAEGIGRALQLQLRPGA